jgi:uncharacterized membrane protein YfcA
MDYGALGPGLVLTLLGILVGGWAGLSGYSGWPLLVPTMWVALGWPLRETLTASLCVDWAAAVAAAPIYLGREGVELRHSARLAVWLVPFGLAGAAVGFAILPRLTPLLELGAGPVAILLGGGLAARSWRLGDESVPADAPARGVPFAAAIRAVGVAATGFAAGLIGMGGGFVLTLLLWLTGRCPPGAAVGTGLVTTALALPAVLAAYGAHARFGGARAAALLSACACTAAASALSERGSARIPSRHLGIAIGACVALAGAIAATRATWLRP